VDLLVQTELTKVIMSIVMIEANVISNVIPNVTVHPVNLLNLTFILWIQTERHSTMIEVLKRGGAT